MKIKKGGILSVLFLGSILLSVVIFLLHSNFFLSRKQIGNSVSFPEKNSTVSVELAVTPYQWSKGLMFREELASGAGMLFVFPNEEIRSFWMKNTLIPLDILFINADKKIVTMYKNVQPCTTLLCPQYASTENAMYVLEVNAGFLNRYTIQEGDQIVIERNDQ